MSKLYIRDGKVVPDGAPGDHEVTFHGIVPNKVICLKTRTGTFYFADEREAHKVMQSVAIIDVSLLPVVL